MNLLNSHDGNSIAVDASVVEGLQNMLDEINPYVQVFPNARDMPHTHITLNVSSIPKYLQLNILKNKFEHLCIY